MTFHDALNYLESRGKRNAASTTGFNKEEEQALCAAVGSKGGCGGAVFVTDFPATQKPFYCAQSTASTSARHQGELTVAAVDLLMPGVGEVVGGSVREVERETLLMRMPGGKGGALGWYAALRGHGGAPHGGFGLGFDRMLLWLLGAYNIRDVVTFPREIGKMYL